MNRILAAAVALVTALPAVLRAEDPPAPSAAAAVVNLVPNSSFEIDTNPGLADCWYYSHIRGDWYAFLVAGVPDYVVEQFGRDTFPTIAVDPTTAMFGEKSLKIANVTPRLKRGAVSHFAAMRPAEYTFSFYAKAEPAAENATPTLLVDIGSTRHNRPFTLTGAWQRYVYSFTSTQAFMGKLCLSPEVPGTYWLDGLQMETGTVANAYVDRAPYLR